MPASHVGVMNRFPWLDLTRNISLSSRSLLQPLVASTATRSVTTLTETLVAQVPEKQKKMAELKKNHGNKV
jgi:hypothetical protein